MREIREPRDTVALPRHRSKESRGDAGNQAFTQSFPIVEGLSAPEAIHVLMEAQPALAR